MPESEKVKVELELPRDQVHIEPPTTSEAPEKEEPEPSTKQQLSEIKKQLDASKEESDGGSEGTGAAQALDKVKSLAAPLDNLPIVQDKSPPNSHQKILIGAGLAVTVLGLILWPLVSFLFGLTVAALGAIIVGAGTFIKV